MNPNGEDNMIVRELIKKLKKQPQDCTVGVSMHDNSTNEVAGLATGVSFVKKEDIPKTDVRFDDRFPGCDCVVIRC